MYKALMTEPLPLFEEEKRQVYKDVVEITVAERTDQDSLAQAVGDYDAILVVYNLVSRQVIEAGKKLKVIGRYGIGTDNIDLEAATEHDIVVTYCPEYHLPTVAEHALALMFSLARKIVPSVIDAKNGNWEYTKFRGVDIEGKTLGLLGLGRTGALMGRKAALLGMQVIGHDPYVTQEMLGDAGIAVRPLDEVIREADFLAVHVPLDDATRGSINSDVFGQMKKTAFLINTSRGPVVDEDALHDALTSGEVAGAALDVMTTEPPGPGHKLYGLENCIITPHTAWYTEEAMWRLEMTGAQNVIDALTGKRPKYVRNVEVYDK